MDISGKEVAVIVQTLKIAHFDELAEKVITHFNELNERIAEVWWTKEDIKFDFIDRFDVRPTEEQIDEALENLNEDLMKEQMIEAGWEQIFIAVNEVKK